MLKTGAKEKNLKSSEICSKTLNNEQRRRRVWPPSHQRTIPPEGSEAHLRSTKWKNISLEPYSWQKYHLKTKAKYRSPKFNRFGSNWQVPEEHGCLVTATGALMAGTTAGPVNTEAKQRQKCWGSRRTTLQHPTRESYTVPA